MSDVLDANQIVLEGIPGQDGPVRFPILGPLFPTYISVFPPKTVIGAYDRASDPLLDSWVQESWAGGMLILHMDESKHADRFWISTCDTRFAKQLTLPPLATATVSPGLPGSEARTGAEYNQRLYVAFDQRIRRWNTTAEAWETPTGVSDAAAVPTCCLVMPFTDTDYLVFGHPEGYLYTPEGSTWTAVARTASIPAPKFLASWDDRLWCLDATNQIWVTDDLTTPGAWNNGARVRVPQDEVLGFGVYFTASGDPVLHAVTRDGLYGYDAVADTWRATQVTFPRHNADGAGFCVRQGDLFLSANMEVFKYAQPSGTVQGVGLNRDWGVEQSYRGDCIALADCWNWLAAGVSATPTTTATALTAFTGDGPYTALVGNTALGQSSIMLWDGVGWHMLWASGVVGSGIHWLQYAVADDQPRLWFGANQTAYYIDMPRGTFNPRELPNWAYAPSCSHTTAWFDSGVPNLDKLAVALEVRGKNVSATEPIAIAYARNNQDLWTPLATVTADEPDLIVFSSTVGGTDGRGLPWRNLRLRYDLARGSTATAAPILLYATLTSQKLLPHRYSYTATVDCSGDSPGGRRPWELTGLLREALESPYLLTLRYARDGQDLTGPHFVKLTRYGGASFTGMDTQGRYQIAITELRRAS